MGGDDDCENIALIHPQAGHGREAQIFGDADGDGAGGLRLGGRRGREGEGGEPGE
ncbi:MAG: hypothetical protein OXU29_03060 [Gammaproteobacteria bacterium]|nr:hypothetical protein [Gammaproteobacteria bacterium]